VKGSRAIGIALLANIGVSGAAGWLWRRWAARIEEARLRRRELRIRALRRDDAFYLAGADWCCRPSCARNVGLDREQPARFDARAAPLRVGLRVFALRLIEGAPRKSRAQRGLKEGGAWAR